MKKWLYISFICAFVLRLFSLDQSLWLDEATTARAISSYSFFDIVTKFSPSDFHPPFYYLFMKLWSSFFGYSEIALRFPSVLFSMLTGFVLYRIGGLWSALFFLFNPLIVYYSQEARMYLMTTFFLTSALYYYLKIADPAANFLPASARLDLRQDLRAVGNPPIRATHNFLLFNIFVFLSFLTFYGSVFFIASLYLYLLYKKQFKTLLFLLPGFLLSVAVVSPLLVQQFANSRQALSTVVNWKQTLGPANLKNLLLIPLKFSFGRITFEPKKLYYVVAGIWTASVFFYAAKGAIKKSILSFFFILPLILGFLFSFFSPLLQYFRFLYLIPVLSLLLALGAKKYWQRIVLLGGFAVLSLIYVINPGFHREDWKSLAKNLPSNATVYMIYSSSDPLRYYRPEIKVLDIRSISAIRNSSDRIIIIPYTADIHGVNYQKLLQKEKYRFKEAKTFRDLSYETWNKQQ